MKVEERTEPVQDSIEKVNDEIAVGSDMEFQRRWWRFERIVWVFFTLLIVMDLLGCFGRGLLAKTTLRAKDGSGQIEYDRIARYSTPSIMTVRFDRNSIHDGKAELWV